MKTGNLLFDRALRFVCKGNTPRQRYDGVRQLALVYERHCGFPMMLCCEEFLHWEERREEWVPYAVRLSLYREGLPISSWAIPEHIFQRDPHVIQDFLREELCMLA